MNLIIDEGNTRIKLAVFKNSYLIDLEVCSEKKVLATINLLMKKYKIKKLIVASVTGVVLELIEELAVDQKIILTNSISIPFKNNYQSPKTLGVDRIALVTAAFKKYPNKNCLIIDAGTCITYDFISDKGIYYGGAIAPGLSMRCKSLNSFTKKLPLVKVKESNVLLIGGTTKTSIESGVFNGMVFEIDGFINSYLQKYGQVNIILTGGDANFLCKQLKNSIFVNTNFLLEGLNEVLTYQNEK